MQTVITDHIGLFPNAPGITNAMVLDVDVGDAKPVKQRPYNLNTHKRALLKISKPCCDRE